MFNVIVPDIYSEEELVAACLLEIFKKDEAYVWDEEVYYGSFSNNDERDKIDTSLETILINIPRHLTRNRRYAANIYPVYFPDGTRYRAANLVIESLATEYFSSILALQIETMHRPEEYIKIAVEQLHNTFKKNVLPEEFWAGTMNSYALQEAYAIILPMVQGYVSEIAFRIREASALDSLKFTRPAVEIKNPCSYTPWFPEQVKFFVVPCNEEGSRYSVYAFDEENYPLKARLDRKGCIAKCFGYAGFDSRQSAIDCVVQSLDAVLGGNDGNG